MKKAFILLSSAILLLTGCAARPTAPSSADESTAVHEFEADDTVYIKAYYYEGYDKYAYLMINASGEVRTGYDEHSMHHDEFSDYIAELSQEPAAYTLSESETDTLTGYLARVDINSEWNGLCGEDFALPDVEVIATYQYLYLDGTLHRLHTWNHYAENLEDENAKAAVSFAGKLKCVWEWDTEVNNTMFAQYS